MSSIYNPQLETFIHVADAGSFNKAAEELYITSPAVIKQMNLLESELDLLLFVRTHRGLSLTEAGKSLYRDAKYLIQYSRDSITRARNAMKTDENVIRIGTSPMTPGHFLVEMWSKIHKICPDIKFQLIPFENTVENAWEILTNLGKNIDIVAGSYDQKFLAHCKCCALELSKEPIRCALSVHHRLAEKEKLTIQDLYGENFMLIQRGWNCNLDALRDDLCQNHPEINVIDFSFFDLSVFNQCENSNDTMLAIDEWKSVHPLLRVMPVDWNYSMSFGLLHSNEPTEIVRGFLNAVQSV